MRSLLRRVCAATLVGGAVALAMQGAPVSAAAGSAVWVTSIVDDEPSHGSGEPSIRVAEDGAIYVTAPAGLAGARSLPRPVGNGGALLWRSDDGGATWTFLPNEVIGGGDADVVPGPGGEVYVSGLSLACVTVAVSEDRGETFTPNPLDCTTSPVDDRQWNAFHDGSVYTSFGGIALDEIYVNRSIVNAPAVVSGPNVAIRETDHQWPGVLAVDPREGTVYQAWGTTGSPNDCDDDGGDCEPRDASTDEPDRIMVAALTDGDFTSGPAAEPDQMLVAERAFDTFDAFVGIDVSPEGVIHVVWNERHPEVQETWSMLASSNDAGETWTAPRRVNTIGTTAFPWVSAGDGGRLAVSYYGTSAKGNSPETVDGEWRVYSAFSDDGGATFDETIVTAAPMHAGAVCTSGTGCAAGARDLIDFFETDVDANGCLLVAYTDNSRDEVVGGVRVTDEPEFIAFARQVAGPGLRAGRTCAAPGAQPSPAASSSPVVDPSVAPSQGPRPRPLPSTGGGAGIALTALLSATAAVLLSRRAARRA